MIAADGTPAFVGLGSNLGGPSRQIARALEMLGELEATTVVRTSGLYRSAPLGGIEQPAFLNAVTLLDTRLDARELLRGLHRIEARLGRDRSVGRWGPRSIDLDLLAFGDSVIDEEGLTVPHPGVGERNFVLWPIREIAPGLVLPGLGHVDDIDVPNEPEIERLGELPGLPDREREGDECR